MDKATHVTDFIPLTIEELRAGLTPEKRQAIRQMLAAGIALTAPIIVRAALTTYTTQPEVIGDAQKNV